MSRGGAPVLMNWEGVRTTSAAGRGAVARRDGVAVFTRDIDEHAITLGATCIFEGRVGPEIEASEDLHQLSIEFLRPDKSRSRPGGSEFTISGQ